MNECMHVIYIIIIIIIARTENAMDHNFHSGILYRCVIKVV